MTKLNKVPFDIANVETEKGEFLLLPDGKTFGIGGDLHSNGGTPQLLTQGTKVFSKKLKASKELSEQFGKKKETPFADLAKRFNTKEELVTLNDPDADDLEKRTAELMFTKKLAQLDGIFTGQELQKQKDSALALENLTSSAESFMKRGGFVKGKKYQKGGKLAELNNPKPKEGVYTNFMANPISSYATFQQGGYWDDLLTKYYTSNPDKFKYIDNGRVEYNPYENDPIAAKVLAGERVRDNDEVLNYQSKYMGYDLANNKWLDDDFSKLQRYGYVKHRLDNKSSGWKHENDIFGVTKDGKLEKIDFSKSPDLGMYTDFRTGMRKNYKGQWVPQPLDGDIWDLKNKVTDNYVPTFTLNVKPKPVDVVNPLPNKPRPLTPVKSENPNTSKPVIPSNPSVTKNPEIPRNPNSFDDIYKMQSLRDIVNLATLDIKPPAYNRTPQNIAYQRFLPVNTLANERQFNLQKEQIENSNLPEQVKAAYLNDLQAKVQDGISEVNLRNYQGDLQTDNNNVNLYNQFTDMNRKERIAYDDRQDELASRMLFNKSQEELRLQDSLFNKLNKYRDERLKVDLVNKFPNNLYFDGQDIQYIPGRGFQDTTNPLQSYQQDDFIKQLDAMIAKGGDEAKNALPIKMKILYSDKK